MPVPDGASVKSGDLLYTIDERPYRAALAQAEATLAQARAQVPSAKASRDLAAREVERNRPLVESGAISKQTFDQLETKFVQADAQSAAATAQVAAAEAQAAGRDLRVDYILATDPGTRHQGVVKEIHEQAEVRGDEGNTVLVRVTIDPSRHEKEELGAGASVTARVACGKRSLGYVWFHDVLSFIQTQVLFRLW
jgi:multidrug resistance efflux pump